MKTIRLALLGLLITASTLSAKKISIVCPEWEEGMALSHIVAILLEDKLDYEVKIQTLGPQECFEATSSGANDLFLNAWLPFTHAEYWAEHNKSVERLGTTYFRATTGLAVPSYMEVTRIQHLNDYADVLDGTITGIEPDAGMTEKTEEVIELYELNYEINSTSTPAMLEAVDAAIKAEEPIVFHA